MQSEETPLLRDTTRKSHYDRFTPSQKRVILAVVSWAGVLPLFTAGSFVPAVPQIAKDLHSTGTVINLAIGLFILTNSLCSLAWATYSGFYGRRFAYLASFPIFCVGSLGVAMSQTVPQLMVSRVLQALGISSGMSVGSGTISDIYKLEERGSALGIYFAAILLGPALAPFIGGFAAHYYSWRHMQFALFVSGVIAVAVLYFFLPETSHPGARGIDKLAADGPKWVWVNPFRCISLLRSPNMMAITLAGTGVLLTDYALLVPLSYTIGTRYNIKNEALIGALFLPVGLGNFIGAPLAGKISDNIVVKWRKRRNGVWVPEDRLRACLIGAGVLVPLSIAFSGLVVEYVPGTLGLILTVVCFFANGLGVDFVLSPSAAYNVDVLRTQSAEIMAANNGFRGIFLAIATSSFLPLINTIGVAATDLIFASIAWVSFGLILLTIKYGERMRNWVDVGFTKEPDE